MLFLGQASNAESPLYEGCIGLIADGDKAALGVLYEALKTAVYGFALSIVHNTQDAEDVLQDTFVTVYASAPRYKAMGKPLAWILRITRNLALMKLRDRKKTQDTPQEAWSQFIADTVINPDDRLVLSAALEGITPEESQIVMLHAISGFKHREIAQVLELPLSTVLSKYNRALKKLKAGLKAGGAYEK